MHLANCKGCEPVFHSLINAGIDAMTVHIILASGDTEGSTVCENSCTRPPVIEAVDVAIFKLKNFPKIHIRNKY